jgi:hypothetical protein
MKEEPKHTPGTWNVSGIPLGRPSVIGDMDEAMANARLIAAAPDMLEAMEVALEFMPEKATIAIEKIKSAIAKAKGEA